MGKEKESKYYDKIYQESESYSCHYKESWYYPMWKIVRNMMTEGKVLEVGCGTVQFAQMLSSYGYDYTGFDFSKQAISMCRYGNVFVGDARKKESYKGEYDTVVCLQV